MKMKLPWLCLVLALAFSPRLVFADAPAIQLVPIVHGLRAPVWLTNDGTSRLYAIEEEGKIRLIQDGQLLPTPYLNISDKVTLDPSTHEAGMLCLAFHPQFAANGKFYVFYMTGSRKAGTLTTIVSEFTAASPTAPTVDRATERKLLVLHKDFLNHNGGMICFGPDGYLYVGLGDGGSEYDPLYRGQKTDDLMGKILRIDVDHKDPGLEYAVPKDNPFVGQSDYRPEIWAVGLRNPWRIAFDPQTNDLYCGEVGQDRYEQIKIITKGGNYGWSILEGTFSMEGIKKHKIPADIPMIIPPIKEYPHPVSENTMKSNLIGRCLIGGFVYRGKTYPSMNGWYIYADYTMSWIAGLRYENGRVTDDQFLTKTKFQISSFGEGADGELYACDWNFGNIYHVTAP